MIMILLYAYDWFTFDYEASRYNPGVSPPSHEALTLALVDRLGLHILLQH